MASGADEESNMLITFATPYGQYRWLRLPFGLSVSSEIFQRHLHQELQGLPGVKCIADDVLIHGTNEADYDSNLERFMGRWQQKGIKLNSQKLELKAKEVPFHGHLLTTEGLKPDPEKVRAIVEMPRPEGRNDILRLSGTVHYLSRFLPNLSDVLKPLRDLTSLGSWGGAVVRAFASHQCVPGSIPGPGVICGLSLLLLLALAPRVFLRVLRFSSLLKNQHF